MNLPVDQPAAEVGWILYDDACGFCRWWVPFWAGVLRRRGLAIAPLQADWVRRRLALGEGELLQDLRLLRADGVVLVGAEVYRFVCRRIWWAWPIYLFSVGPVGRDLFDWGYRTFAANRYRVSRACRLRPPR